MTSQAAENTNPLSDETRKLIDGWLEPDGPVALHLRQKLLPSRLMKTASSSRRPMPTSATTSTRLQTAPSL
jgi:hypothetical protein